MDLEKKAQATPKSLPVEIVQEQAPATDQVVDALFTKLAETLKQGGDSLNRVTSISVRTRLIPEVEITTNFRDAN